MSPEKKVHLVTGANRGIGRGMIAEYLSRSNTIAIAAVRDTEDETSKTLNDLTKGPGSELIVVKIDSTSPHDAAEAVSTIGKNHGIHQLDTVVANAGLATGYGPVLDIRREKLQEMVEVNVYGPLALFQATQELLMHAATPKFVFVSTRMGSMGRMEKAPFPVGAYGATKAMMNFLVRKIHFENEKLIAFSIYPGFANTLLGAEGGRQCGAKGPPRFSAEECAGWVVSAIDNATLESSSGRFLDAEEGGEVPW